MLPISADNMLTALRAAGEPTRLRILALLAEGERSVKDLTDILGQSQPRISRHLKLLVEAGLVRRYAEGAWAFFRLADSGPAAELSRDLVDRLNRNDPVMMRDRTRLEAVRRARLAEATAYFRQHAAHWDQIRSLHANEQEIEAGVLRLVGDAPLDLVVDLGTGTGRMLELLAPHIESGIGIDVSHDMLSYARSRLEREGLRNCQVRQGDIYSPPIEDGSADLVIIHQVLHYLDDPDRAIEEAAYLLKPGGRLLIIDFAPHGLEFLRADQAHRRLGFSREQIAEWMKAAGIELASHIDFPPDDVDIAEVGRLTVSIWLGKDTDSRVRRGISEEAA
ncbi:ArsR/SmtB family transcription factor [Microbaculum marinisediminis]|uniref:Metalloregulator ArsR/SmtB family transcription factor n=1 Tax=Microbaculum marinisediminis TaxID=2931392 RepID=A0AAW5R041_9HYPH|nr:metalloregulator ArsR/SmtB family transcription factor [Microbaculum sp. A6E488]MCT8972524.1 metalloregulator ArsR/SmtB family transcription factor [Microbaculum sp. A6E488]